MSISILNRGASGGLKPELTVTAPAGSTIDLLLNSVIVDTYTLGASETEHTFVVELGTYTVQGTLGEETKSVEVLVDAVGQYAVTIVYALWLYREGDECDGVTGGWTGVSYEGRGSTAKNSDSMVMRTNNTQYSNCAFFTNNKINVTEYSVVKLNYSIAGQATGRGLSLCTAKPTSNSDIGENNVVRVSVNGDNNELDVSSLTGSYYVKLYVRFGQTSYYATTTTIYDVWLE